MKQKRTIVCPQCGSRVRLPWPWILGIEMVFRCPSCRLVFKTGYKTGAALSALSLTLALGAMQLAVYLLSPYLMIPACAAAIPLWIWIASRMRRAVLLRRASRRVRASRRAS